MLFAGFRRALQRGFVGGHIARMRALSSTPLPSPVQWVREAEIDKFEMQTNKNLMSVTWKDGSTNRYPFLHLRDYCQCPQCWHSSQQRLFDTFNQVELDVQPSKVEVSPDGKKMAIIWPDDHVSEFDSEFLFEKRLPETAEETTAGQELTVRPVHLWDKSLEANIPRIPFNDILHEDEALYTWLNTLYHVGLVYVTDAPKEPGQVEKLGQRVAYIKPTVYG